MVTSARCIQVVLVPVPSDDERVSGGISTTLRKNWSATEMTSIALQASGGGVLSL